MNQGVVVWHPASIAHPVSHREDLLEAAIRCLYEKGYARTTARDLVAESGTNLGSIGYHYGSKERLMNEALMVAFHRWLDGAGRDVVVVASFNDLPFGSYALGFPQRGEWLEVFNTDVYQDWVNHSAVGNGGRIAANGPPLHTLPTSATISIPGAVS